MDCDPSRWSRFRVGQMHGSNRHYSLPSDVRRRGITLASGEHPHQTWSYNSLNLSFLGLSQVIDDKRCSLDLAWEFWSCSSRHSLLALVDLFSLCVDTEDEASYEHTHACTRGRACARREREMGNVVVGIYGAFPNCLSFFGKMVYLTWHCSATPFKRVQILTCPLIFLVHHSHYSA